MLPGGSGVKIICRMGGSAAVSFGNTYLLGVSQLVNN